MKYIDADRLRAEIKRWIRLEELNFAALGGGGQEICINTLEWVLKQIDSLQQEQPEVDLVAELKHHLATTPKEQLEKEWKELEPWNNIGPTVQEFLYGKQPEVDLEKEIEEYFPEWAFYIGWNYDDMEEVARHFYELGLNARK